MQDIQKVSLKDSGYRVYPYRYIITILFCLSKLIASMMYSCYSPILVTLTILYNEGLPYITLGTNSIWLINYATIGFVANYVLDDLGIKKGILLGNLLSLIGLWLRVCAQSQDDFIFIFLGQFCAAAGAPFIINAPQKISATWHAPEKGPFFTAIHAVMGPLGIGLGLGLTQLFIDDNPSSVSVGLQELAQMNYFYAILGTVVLVPTFLLFKEKPPVPPSKAAEAKKTNYMESLKSLWNNKNYVNFLIGAGSFYGAFNVTSVVLEPLTMPFGFAPSQAGTLGAFTILFGMIGAITMGNYVSKRRNLKQTIVRMASCSIISLFIVTFVLYLESMFLLGIFIAIFGFTTISLLPMFLELCNELTFPVNEATAGGLCIMINQFIGFFYSELITWVVTSTNNARLNSNISILLIIILQIFGLYKMNSIKEDLRRSRYESESNDSSTDVSMIELQSKNNSENFSQS